MTANRLVENVPTAELKPFERNARVHSKKQINQIARSIEEFGFTSPILADRGGEVLAGHGRLEAAKLLGMESVPVLRVEHLTEAQKRAYIIADNKIALNSDWDLELLSANFAELVASEQPFDAEITGFETAEIDRLIDGPQTETRLDPIDNVPDLKEEAVSRHGDLWLLGPHKLFCGDARDPLSYATLLGDEKVRVGFTDPPYNVPISGHVSGLGAIKHREFAMACGEMSEAEFTSFLRRIFENMRDASLDGAINFVCIDWRHVAELLDAGKGPFSQLKAICVWNKDNGGMGSFYRSKHEFVVVFKVGQAPHVNTIELGRAGRYRTNVWDYAGVNTFRAGRNSELEMHPTVKPTALVIDAIKDCSRRGELVLDPFCGSGTTIMAAHKCGRVARAVEYDPLYVDVAIRRWQKFSKQAAVLAASGVAFEDLALERLDPLL